MKHKTGNIKRIIFFSAVLFFALFARASASSRVYFEAPKEVSFGSEFSVKIFIDSEEKVNAYLFEVGYPVGLEFSGYDANGSIVDIWQQLPKAGSGKISFGGGSVRSFFGGKGKIVELGFRARKDGRTRFDFTKAEFFLADGKGTMVLPQTESATVAVLKPGELPAETAIETSLSADKTPPEILEIALFADPFDKNRKLLGFLAKDDISGIKETKIRVRSGIFWNDWVSAGSPIGMPAGVWAIDFVAADNNGNVAEKIIYDWQAFAVFLAKYLLGIVALIFATFGVRKIIKNRKKVLL